MSGKVYLQSLIYQPMKRCRKINLRIDELFVSKKCQTGSKVAVKGRGPRLSFDDMYNEAKRDNNVISVKHPLLSPKQKKRTASVHTLKQSQAWREEKEQENTAATHKEFENQFMDEFGGVVKALDHSRHAHIRETQCFLSVNDIKTILKQLSLLRQDNCLQSIWAELQGETYGGIPSKNLLDFLLCVIYPPKLQYKPINAHLPSKAILVDCDLRTNISDVQRRIIFDKYAHLRNYWKSKNYPLTLLSSKKNSKQYCNKQNFKEAENKSSVKNNNKPKHRTISLPLVKQEQKLVKQNSISEMVASVRIKKPILSVDVNLGEGRIEKVIVYEGETAFEVSQRLVQRFGIDEAMRGRFETMLNNHLKNILWKIQEVEEQMITDRQV